jgi:hypothetical protein
MSIQCPDFVILHDFEILYVNVTYTASKAVFELSVNGKTKYSIYRSKDAVGRKIWVSLESLGMHNLAVSTLGKLIDRYLKQRAKL